MFDYKQSFVHHLQYRKSGEWKVENLHCTTFLLAIPCFIPGLSKCCGNKKYHWLLIYSFCSLQYLINNNDLVNQYY